MVAVFLGLILLGALSSCGGRSAKSPEPASEVSSQVSIVRWISGPQVTQGDASRNEFVMEVTTGSGAVPKSIEVLELKPFMKVHGHGVPKAYVPVWSVEANQIRVQRLGFIMAGPWEIQLSARVDGAELNVEIPVEVP